MVSFHKYGRGLLGCNPFYEVRSRLRICVVTIGPFANLRSTNHIPIQIDWQLDHCVSWIQNRIRECERDHAACKTIGLPTLPTRVLDLEQFGTHQTIRLKTTNGESATYATLSHCWGHIQPLTTTASTIDERSSAIDLTDLPPTFRDAATVAYKLGIRYLWIDSLCIIQNDKHDWEIESSRMADVYSNAFFNLAATGSRDSSGGLFKQGQNRFLEVQEGEAKVFVRLGSTPGHRLNFAGFVGSSTLPLVSRRACFVSLSHGNNVSARSIVAGSTKNGFWPAGLSTSCLRSFSGNAGQKLPASAMDSARSVPT
jgi:hypothetical protein